MKIEDKDIFKAYILSGKTIAQLHNCGKETVIAAKRKWGFIGLSPNSAQRRINRAQSEKLCSSCNSRKPLMEFHSNGYTPTGTQKFKGKCKTCSGISNIPAALKTLNKDYKCEICGYNKNPAAIEFHHINSLNKEFEISSKRTLSVDRLIIEIKKCKILCANCHREIHNPL